MDPLKFASISGSHSNQVLRLFLYQAKHERKDSAPSGKLSLEMLDAHDPCFFETVSKGAMWEVISSEVVAHFDTLVPLAQSARNVSAQVSQNETELQICRKILAFMKDGTCPNYDEIAPMILRSRPRNAAWPIQPRSGWQSVGCFVNGIKDEGPRAVSLVEACDVESPAMSP